MCTTSRIRPLMLAGVVSALAAAGPAPAQSPFSFDSAFGRLPKNVVPIDYKISIVPDATQLTFSGSESVVLEFRQSTGTIVLNSLNETLNHVQLDGRAVKSTASDDKQQ